MELFRIILGGLLYGTALLLFLLSLYFAVCKMEDEDWDSPAGAAYVLAVTSICLHVVAGWILP